MPLTPTPQSRIRFAPGKFVSSAENITTEGSAVEDLAGASEAQAGGAIRSRSEEAPTLMALGDSNSCPPACEGLTRIQKRRRLLRHEHESLCAQHSVHRGQP